jgi:hypothetical protein
MRFALRCWVGAARANRRRHRARVPPRGFLCFAAAVRAPVDAAVLLPPAWPQSPWTARAAGAQGRMCACGGRPHAAEWSGAPACHPPRRGRPPRRPRGAAPGHHSRAPHLSRAARTTRKRRGRAREFVCPLFWCHVTAGTRHPAPGTKRIRRPESSIGLLIHNTAACFIICLHAKSQFRAVEKPLCNN